MTAKRQAIKELVAAFGLNRREPNSDNLDALFECIDGIEDAKELLVPMLEIAHEAVEVAASATGQTFDDVIAGLRRMPVPA